MLVSIVIALLGVISTISASAVLPARQEPPPPPASPTLYPCTPIWRTATVAETTITITAAPDTVTIVVVDSASVSVQFSTQGRIDSIQAQQESQLAPVNHPSTGTPTFIHTASATAYEATEAPGDGTSVYYVPKGPGAPPESLAVATTTVVVMPTQAPPPGPHREINSTIFNTSFRTATATVTGYGVWSTSAAAVDASTGGYGMWNISTGASTDTQGTTLVSPDDTDIFTATTTTYLATSTKAVFTQTTISTVVNGSFPGYGDLPTATSPQPAVLVPRQTCTWVDNEDYGGWCNDWNGETTVRYSSYETTIYPPKTTRHLTPPGPPVPASEPVSTSEPVPTSEPPAVLTVTVTQSIPANTIPPSQPETINGTEPTQSEPTTSDQFVQPAPTDLSTPSQSVSTNVTQSPQPAPSNATQPTQPEPVNTTQPEHCGQWGPFVVGFDELPASNTDDPLIFNPFDHFWWGDYWTYAPPPVGPYPPVDGSQLAKCDASDNNTIAGSPNAGGVPPNGFGAGPRNSSDVYWFNATSAYVGCETRPTDLNASCKFDVTAWVFDGDHEVPIVTDGFVIPPCANNTNCRLTEITFPERYMGLTTLNFSATVAGESRAYYMDSLHLGWYNNSCEAGLTRILSRKKI